jgi:hypothetical protein
MFQPYWLIHEPGKVHGFAIVDLDSAISEEAAIDEWRAELRSNDPGMLASIEMHGTEVAARLITKPLVVG